LWKNRKKIEEKISYGKMALCQEIKRQQGNGHFRPPTNEPSSGRKNVAEISLQKTVVVEEVTL